MGVFELTQKEFDNLIKNSLRLYGCPKCGGSVDVLMELPIYGAYKIGFKCRHCGNEVKDYLHGTPISTDKKFGTPVTPIGLAKALFNVAELWNTESKQLRKELQNEVLIFVENI